MKGNTIKMNKIMPDVEKMSRNESLVVLYSLKEIAFPCGRYS